MEGSKSTTIAGGEENQCRSLELDDLIQVRKAPPLLKSGCKATGKNTERLGSQRMAWRTEDKSSSSKPNDLVQVRQGTSLLESDCKAGERRGSTRMAGRVERQNSSVVLDGIIQIRWGAPLLESLQKGIGKIGGILASATRMAITVGSSPRLLAIALHHPPTA